MKRKLTARENAAKLCSLRRQTKTLLRSKLTAKGYDVAEVEGAVTAMEDGGYIDEWAYACAFVNDSYRIKKHGHIRILNELKRRGIASDMAEEALAAADIDETELLSTEMQRRFPKGEAPEKIYRYFLLRGFSQGDIRRCMHE